MKIQPETEAKIQFFGNFISRNMWIQSIYVGFNCILDGRKPINFLTKSYFVKKLMSI